MIKLVLPSAWNWDIPPVQQIKVARRGFFGQDYTDLAKRAGEKFAYQVKNAEFPNDEIPVHMIALGSTERWGPNRNGDGFKEATCKRDHQQFITKMASDGGAFYYRNHKNKDPRKSYGYVKSSCFNDEMGRIELIAMLNANEKSASRNKGLVADIEQNLLASGHDLPVSMSCKIAYDVCDACGKKSASPREYCTDKTCTYGGCREKLANVYSDGYMQHVDNPYPNWFDISGILEDEAPGYQADRTAYGASDPALFKQAALNGIPLGGAALAEYMGIEAPVHLSVASLGGSLTPFIRGQVKLAHEMARCEKYIEQNYALFQKAATGNIAIGSSAAVEACRNYNPTGLLSDKLESLHKLASQFIVLPAETFFRKIRGVDSESVIKEAVESLPGVYQRLIDSDRLSERIKSSSFRFDRIGAGNPSSATSFIQSHEDDVSLDIRIVNRRIMKSAIREKTACYVDLNATQNSSGTIANDLAEDYAIYKLAALAVAVGNAEGSGVVDAAVRQHYVL